VCWGYNHLGQLGNGATAESMVPVDVVGLSADVVEIAAGDDHTCARLSTGAIKCWGDNVSGQLGYAGAGSLVPVAVAGF
jgi:alpha-tubulin suppressor-like RCC1 family protein